MPSGRLQAQARAPCSHRSTCSQELEAHAFWAAPGAGQTPCSHRSTCGQELEAYAFWAAPGAGQGSLQPPQHMRSGARGICLLGGFRSRPGLPTATTAHGYGLGACAFWVP